MHERSKIDIHVQQPTDSHEFYPLSYRVALPDGRTATTFRANPERHSRRGVGVGVSQIGSKPCEGCIRAIHDGDRPAPVSTCLGT